MTSQTHSASLRVVFCALAALSLGACVSTSGHPHRGHGPYETGAHERRSGGDYADHAARIPASRSVRYVQGLRLDFAPQLGCYVVAGHRYHYHDGDRFFRWTGRRWEHARRWNGGWKRSDVDRVPRGIRYHTPRIAAADPRFRDRLPRKHRRVRDEHHRADRDRHARHREPERSGKKLRGQRGRHQGVALVYDERLGLYRAVANKPLFHHAGYWYRLGKNGNWQRAVDRRADRWRKIRWSELPKTLRNRERRHRERLAQGAPRRSDGDRRRSR